MTRLLKEIGFESINDFKTYMKSKAKWNEYGAFCHNETRQGLELNYSHNCNKVFGIGGHIKGQFIDNRFN